MKRKNTKKPTTKPKGQQTPAAPRTRGKTGPSRGGTIPRQHLDTIIGIINPFSPQARGMKYPDQSNTRTLPTRRQQRLEITVGANGIGGMLFLPNYAYEFAIPAVSGTGGQMTMPVNVNINLNRIQGSAYRIVSWGVRVTCIAAPLNASGMVAIRGWNTADGAGLDVVNASSYSSSFSEDIPLQDCKDVIVIGQVNDLMRASFTDVSSDFSAGETATAPLQNWTRRGFNCMSIFVTGAPASTAVLSVELIAHYELTFLESDQLGILTTTAPVFQPHVEGAHRHISSKMKNVFKKGGEQLAKHAVEQAGAAMANYLMPGSGPVASHMIKDVE